MNVFFGFASLLGLFDLVMAMSYAITAIVVLLRRRNTANGTLIILYSLQLLCVPLPLVLAGAIYFFQGWRLDPILQFGLLLLHVPILFSVVKDWLMLRNRT